MEVSDWLPLVRKVVGRHAARREGDREEMVQVGLIAVMGCIRRYNPDGGAAFMTYAWNSIVFAIRRWREKEKLFRRRAGKKMHLFSECGSDYVNGSASIFAREMVEPGLDEATVLSALAGLPARSREVLRMRLFEDATLREVGKRFQITQERVRQIEIRAKNELRHHAAEIPLLRDGAA